MKGFNFSSNKQKIFVILLIILANSLMFYIFIKSMFNVFKLPVTNTIKAKEFTTELEKMNCKVINQKINNKNKKVNIYLITDKNSCPYLVSYITFDDEDTKLNVAHDFANEVLNKNENLKIKNTINILNKYIEYNSTGNNYKAFTMYKNSILYGSTNKKYKKEMINIFNKFHYRYVPNARNLKKLNYILLIYALIVLVSYSKIEKKCGKKGWIIFIPFYNLVIFNYVYSFFQCC